jgi:hypothetical protein
MNIRTVLHFRIRGELDDLGRAFFMVQMIRRRNGGKHVLPARIRSDRVRRG